MKTKIVKVELCNKKKCGFNIGQRCITRPEMDSHNNCLSYFNKNRKLILKER